MRMSFQTKPPSNIGRAAPSSRHTVTPTAIVEAQHSTVKPSSHFFVHGSCCLISLSSFIGRLAGAYRRAPQHHQQSTHHRQRQQRRPFQRQQTLAAGSVIDQDKGDGYQQRQRGAIDELQPAQERLQGRAGERREIAQADDCQRQQRLRQNIAQEGERGRAVGYHRLVYIFQRARQTKREKSQRQHQLSAVSVGAVAIIYPLAGSGARAGATSAFERQRARPQQDEQSRQQFYIQKRFARRSLKGRGPGDQQDVERVGDVERPGQQQQERARRKRIFASGTCRAAQQQPQSQRQHAERRHIQHHSQVQGLGHCQGNARAHDAQRGHQRQRGPGRAIYAPRLRLPARRGDVERHRAVRARQGQQRALRPQRWHLPESQQRLMQRNCRGVFLPGTSAGRNRRGRQGGLKPASFQQKAGGAGSARKRRQPKEPAIAS